LAINSSKKVILYCHNDYATSKGGEYSVFQNDVALLEKMGYCVLRYEKNNSVLFRGNILRRVLMIFNTFFNFKVYKEINMLVKEKKIDFAFIQNTYLIFSPSIYLAFYRNNIPIIQMIYNYRFICPNAHLYTKGKLCEKCVTGNKISAVINKCVRNSILISLWYTIILFIMKKLIKVDKQIKYFVVPDKFMMGKLVEGGIDPQKVLIMKNPYLFHDDDDKIVTNERYFIFVGRLVKQKGIYTFLEAACNLQHIQFKIVGDGEEKDNVLEYIRRKQLKNIEFLGALYNESLKNIIRKATAVIVPSEWYDNYPVVISLAYDNYKPVIATNINGIPEVVINNKTGLLFRYKDVKDLCSKIVYLFNNPNITYTLGMNGKEYIKSELSNQKRLESIIRIFKNETK